MVDPFEKRQVWAFGSNRSMELGGWCVDWEQHDDWESSIGMHWDFNIFMLDIFMAKLIELG